MPRGWPKGVPRKPKIVSHETIDSPDLVLTVRRIQVGSFAGLWELRKVLPDGSTEVLTDANTKGIVANLAYNEVAKCGT